MAAANERKLTNQQQLFVDLYNASPDMNATDCARQAYPRTKYPDKVAYQLLENPRVRKAIDEARAKRAEKAAISAQWVLDRLVELSERCMQAEPVLDREGNSTGEYRFDSSGANKALENIGKHLGMFKDKLELSGKVTQDVNYNLRKLSAEELAGLEHILEKSSNP